MLFEWFAREGWVIPAWWLLVTLAGLAVLPLCVRLLGALPDKGVLFARAIGMVLVGFVYWFLGSLGFLNNSAASITFAWLIVLLVALGAYFSIGERFNLRAYWRENRAGIIVAEVLFFLLFFCWTVYRAYQNDTFTTEKPMEIAFISAIMRSDSFPPNDPWMAGYSISYYYFGYVMSAMLSLLSGVNSGVGFSLTSSLWFALAGLSAYGVGYNLVRSRQRAVDDDTSILADVLPDTDDTVYDSASENTRNRSRPRKNDDGWQIPASVFGVLAAILVIFMGNFQLPLIEYPHRANIAPPTYFDFWQAQGFLDVSEADNCRSAEPNVFSTPFTDPGTWNCGGWWWWHTSRILVDRDISGAAVGNQPIDEVPAFSYLLMDNHPHVLALPFVLMTIGLAFNLLLTGRDPNRWEILLYGIVIGGLIFLNTWDGPIYLVVLLGADVVRRLQNRQTGRLVLSDWLGTFGFAVALVAIAVIAFAPFLIGFRSQAGGILPNLITPTLFQQYFLMFGPVLLLSSAFLLVETWRGQHNRQMNWQLGFSVSGLLVLALLLIFAALIVASALIPNVRNTVTALVEQNGGFGAVLPLILERRVTHIVLPLVLLLMLSAIIARLFPRVDADSETAPRWLPPATNFGLLLLGCALGLTLIPEFFFLRDNFGVRINTIFKFYYQAWVLMAIVGAYGVYTILSDVYLPRPAVASRAVFGVMLAFILVTGMAYPIFGVYSRAILEEGRLRDAAASQDVLTLDGRGEHFGIQSDYYEAVMCLGDLVEGDDVVVAEASQRTYNSPYGRVGAFTGIPTVINWEGHQSQWRGATYSDVAGSRREDIDRLYTRPFWEDVVDVVEQYSIDYIVFGPTERAQFGAEGEAKFEENLALVCDFGDARVYSTGTGVAPAN